ncbi:MAG: NUDIX domain-containing protein [Anaerolineae bacterium]|jgi:8-oxo-dGTP pyrophosphatase MutT (NUDIX family)|nr:NUDIX domain-containing protein [Anaerolineae bacterium]MBT7781793.1 NUDIX domain-containing protein [Anaerolineae bacterium]
MKLLKTIYHDKNINLEGKTFFREAVRGIIFCARKILMIYSPIYGDYKFPGGGVHAEERHIEALRREIIEECGAEMTEVTGELGKTQEYAINQKEEDYETFKMTSYYYFCEIKGKLGAQNLDDYEEKLGYKPEWVDIDIAIEKNKQIEVNSNSFSTWRNRETFVLEELKKKMSFT